MTAADASPDALRIALGIEATAPTATEDSTMEPTTTKIVAAAPSAAAGKATKTKKGAKSASKAKAAKSKKEKPPKQPLCVFAFRLSEADRDLIHRAAGKGGATRFVRSAAIAVATGDTNVLTELTAQARQNTK